jgi:hypothetical protein
MLVSTVHRHLFPPVLLEVLTLRGVSTPLGSDNLGDVSHPPWAGPDDPDSSTLGSRPDTDAALTRSAILGIATLAMLVTVIALFVDGGAASLAKWTLFFGCALLASAGAKVLPAVWDNRRDDKIAVLFVAAFVLLMFFGMWEIFTSGL